jgi:diguanylate cyclase (GGDEF)-like protein
MASWQGNNNPLITATRGYIWFLALNILFSVWLLLHDLKRDTPMTQPAGVNALTLFIALFAVLNLVAVLKIHPRISDNLYPKVLPAVVMLFGTGWALVFFNLLLHYATPLLTLTLAVIILLPAVITFYLSTPLLLLFCTPVVLSLIYGEYRSDHRFDLLQNLGMAIILLVVYSARYILLEWYQRTQRSEYEKSLLIKKLTRLAHFDALTGLYNRRSLADYVNERRRDQSRQMFLLVMDIDFFKQYNDTYGHVAGDECLVKVARCIETSLRKAEDAAFRYGGEEFVVVALCEKWEEAQAIAQRIRQNLAQAQIPHAGSEVSPWVTLSVGIARAQPTMALEDLLEAADHQLYKAKRAGRDRITFDARAAQ